jgi:L-malate glycosyltransferase
MRGVIMLVNKFPPVPAGGAERQAERLSEYLSSQGIAVGVITRSAPKLPTFEQRATYWVERIPQPGIGKLKTLTFMLGAAIKLFRRRKNYDILHAHLAFAPALVAVLAARMLGKKVIVKYGTSGKYGDVCISQQTLRGRVRLALLRRWSHVSVVLDADMEQEILGAGFSSEDVWRMDNGIDQTGFTGIRSAAAKAELGLTGRTVLIYTGRLVSQKGLPVLLTAFHEVLQNIPSLHLLLVGQGSERAQLEMMAQELDIKQQTTFVGNVEDVRPYLSAADIFVLPSEGEGISNALLEAMAAGLACIATTVGGSAEVLDNGNCGKLVDAGSVEQLREAITILAIHPEEIRRLGNAAEQRIQTRYALSVVGEAYRRLYINLLHNSAKSVRRVPSVNQQERK